MKAVIMAGGEGTRLRPLTSTQPKPMLPMADVPMMEHVVRLLSKHGFDEIVVTVAYMANAIRTYFGDGSDFGVKISYVSEESPLGTAGSVGNARDIIDERFLVISGDVLTDTNLEEVWKYHISQDALATVVLQRVENPLEFGIVTTNPDGSISRFLEKPSWGEVFTDTVNTGIYILEPEIFDYIPQGHTSDFSSDIFPKLLEEGKPLYGWISERYWEDVGTIAGYLKAHRDILDAKVNVEIDAFALREGLYLGEGSYIHPTVEIEEPVLIGTNSRIGAHVKLRRYSVLGSNSKIGDDVTIENSILSDHCFVGSSCQIRGAVIGRNTDLRHGVIVEDGAVIGDDCYLGEDAIIQPFVKIYPSKTVQSRTTVNTSIVWESQATRATFDAQGISGLPNIDISPELAVRVGMAYGSTLPPGARLVASRDTSLSARMIKRALMVGINAVGVTVVDLEVAATPLARYVAQYGSAAGGIRVSVSSLDPQMIDIRFHGADGGDLGEGAKRKIERALQREDFRKVLASEIGDLSFPGRVAETYVESLLELIPIKAIRERQFRIVTDYSFGTIGALMHTAFGKLDAEVLSLNPYGATGRMLSVNRLEQRENMRRTVREARADLGVIFDASGESFELVDDEGHLLFGHELALVMTELFGQEGQFAVAHITVDCSNKVREAAIRNGLGVTWSKANTASLCQDTLSDDRGPRGESEGRRGSFGVSASGALILPGVVEGPDPVFNLGRVLGALANTDAALSKISRRSGSVYLRSARVHTPFELKGSVMRYLLEHGVSQDALLVDGIRTEHHDGGFTLIAPDAVDAFTNVTVEGASEKGAEERLGSTVDRLSTVMREL